MLLIFQVQELCLALDPKDFLTSFFLNVVEFSILHLSP